MASEAPSGRQVELAWGDQRAIVTEVGAGVRSYSAGGRAVLDGFGVDQMCDGGRGQVLAPWPNRLAGGRYRFDGDDLQLPFDPGRSSALHGLVRWANWEVLHHESDRADLGLVLHPRPGYPFTLALRVAYRLGADGLAVTTTAANAGDRPLPFGIGFHPYLTVGTDSVDQALLAIPSGTGLETDAGGIPTGDEVEVEVTPLDFRTPRPIGDLHLDACFTRLDRDGDGRSQVVLAAPDEGPAVTLWMDRRFDYVMVFTGDTLTLSRRRQGLAVEPMTCAPDAFNNGLGLQVLACGEATTCSWGIRP